MKKLLLKIIILFCLLGILLSSYSLYHHYTDIKGICNINDTFSCDVVNRSVYSEFLGIPVALIGIIGYIAILAASYLALKEDTKQMHWMIFLMSLTGFLFTLYLTYIEAFVLYVFCPVCLVSAGFITLMLIISIILLIKKH